MTLFGFKKSEDGWSAKDIFREGFAKQAKNFKRKGSSPEQFKKLNYPAWAVKAMGYSAAEMLKGGYSIRSLKMAGFTEEEINHLV